MAGLVISLSPELEARLQAEAERRSVSAEELVETILADQLAEAPRNDTGTDARLSGARLLELFAELRKSVPEEEWERLPPDLSEHHDHYLYGTPRR